MGKLQQKINIFSEISHQNESKRGYHFTSSVLYLLTITRGRRGKTVVKIVNCCQLKIMRSFNAEYFHEIFFYEFFQRTKTEIKSKI
jgi:hypothetical protein